MGCTFDGPSVMIAKGGGVTQQLQVKLADPLLMFVALPIGWSLRFLMQEKPLCT